MDLNWLDDVLVLLEEGNMTRAAERRNITQPAFSRRIRSFEDWLGKPILDRQTNRIEINANLASNEAEIRALVARIRDLRTNIAHYEPLRTSVTIAAQHAPICSSFPDMLLRARGKFPKLRVRLRAGNLNDCVSVFLRGDASLFLCHDAEATRQLEFGDGILRGRWGGDFLVPVVGGSLRYAVNSDGTIPAETPAVVYPDDSHFGAVLRRGGRIFGSPSYAENPVCVTAFSSGTLELIRSGVGIGWLPYSMAYRDIAAGNLISLANALGQEALSVLLFANRAVPGAAKLLEFWKNERPVAEA